MAIFNKSDKESNSGATIIAKGTKIRGEIDTDCNLHIDGEFEGTISSKSSISIGKSGLVNGELYADNVIVSGNVSGVVNAVSVEVLPDGKLFGKVISDEFMIESSGVFEGERKIKSNPAKNSVNSVKDAREGEKSLDFKVKEVKEIK